MPFYSFCAQKDSLKFYLETAVKNNPGLLQKFSEYQASLQNAPKAGSLPDPELTAGVYLVPMALTEGKQLADLRLMQMFPWPGTLKAAREEMNMMARAKYAAFSDAQLQLYYDIEQTWYELMRNQSETSINRQNQDLLQVIRRLALASFSAPPESAEGKPGSYMERPGNEGGLAGLYRIEIEINDLANSRSMLENEHKALVARFNGLLSRQPQTPVFLDDSLVPESQQGLPEILPDSAFKNTPGLVMLDYERKSLEYRQSMEKRMGYPMLGLGVDYSVIKKSDMSTSSMNGRDMIMPMLTVTLPVYRHKYRAMQAGTQWQRKASEQEYTAGINSLQTAYYKTVQDKKDAERQIELFTSQAELTKKTLDIMLKSFSVNSSTLSDILRVQQQMLDYSLQRVRAIAVLNISLADMRRMLAVSQLQ